MTDIAGILAQVLAQKDQILMHYSNGIPFSFVHQISYAWGDMQIFLFHKSWIKFELISILFKSSISKDGFPF